ncbi:hypothetical protein GCM10018966_015890 [Streptomyces yanii]
MDGAISADDPKWGGPGNAVGDLTGPPGEDTVLIGDGAPVPTRDRGIAAFGETHRYPMNMQVVIDANSRPGVLPRDVRHTRLASPRCLNS